jgi:hypothetical protein
MYCTETKVRMCRLPMTSNQSSKAIGRLKLAVKYPLATSNTIEIGKTPGPRRIIERSWEDLNVAEEQKKRPSSWKEKSISTRLGYVTQCPSPPSYNAIELPGPWPRKSTSSPSSRLSCSSCVMRESNLLLPTLLLLVFFLVLPSRAPNA